MLKAVAKKIKSAPKNIRLGGKLLLLISVVFALVLILIFYLLPRSTSENIKIGNHAYDLSIAKTASQQEKGLGGRSSLPVNQGMLFVFNGEAMRCFWMKDMHFPLDMIWLNSSKQVVALLQNVSPGTYPKVFCPRQSAQYVIELNAGQVAAAHIYSGETLKF